MRRQEPQPGADAKTALGIALAKKVAAKRKEHLRLTLLIVGGAVFLGIVWLLLDKLVYSTYNSIVNLDHQLKSYKAQDKDGDDAGDAAPGAAASASQPAAKTPATQPAAAP